MLRFNRSILAMTIFLLGFGVLIVVVSYYFLFPAIEAAKGATVPQKRQLMAYSRLMLAVVLFVLCVATLLVFQVRRFFFPRPIEKREKTQYVDVWAESGRRAPVPPTDPDADGDA